VLAIDRRPSGAENFRHPPRAIERRLQELLVDPPHQRQVRRALAARLAIKRGAVQLQ
jgi:hypothetical protein